MYINCENCRDGMCVYIPKNLKMVIYQKCPCTYLSEKDRANVIKNCASKTLIRKIKERDKILGLKKLDENF